MIQRLKFSVTFPSTGKSFAGDHRFSKGMTAITGANESGKSLRLELIRYSLYGSDALRGAAPDYKELKVELWFMVQGKGYHVIRNGKKATLYCGPDELAVGVTPVNARIAALLGFGLNVFDVACCISQGDVEALSDLKPAERKRMVDNVVGMAFIEELTKWAGEKAKECRTVADTLRGTLREPVAPEMPEGYQIAAFLHGEVKYAEACSHERAQIQGWLSHEPPEIELPECPCEETVEELEALVRERNRIIKSLPPRTDFTAEQVAEFEREYELGQANDEWERRDKERQRLHARWVNMRDHKVVCPQCQYEWALNQKEIDDAEAKVVAADPGPAPRRQAITTYTRAQIDSLARSVSANAAWGDLPPDRSEDLARRRDYDRANLLLVRRETWLNERVQKLQRLEYTDRVASRLGELRAAHEDARSYERDLSRYQGDVAAHARRVAEVKSHEDEAEQWAKARKALDALRAKIKAFLLPSLNKVASVLLAKMTAGKRSSVVVDDLFEVTVDGQPLHTLSGSGKAVANLAVRIGLGQVLTNRVFSVLLADEIDASMDDERAEATAETVRGLCANIGQILLVSHKEPEADHQIAV